MQTPTGVRILCTIAATTLLGACGINETDIKMVGLGEARQLHTQIASKPQSAIFVDARPPSQYVAGHIAGAVNWRLDQFKPKAKVDPRIEPFAMIVVYGSDPSSPAARGLTKRLMSIGYENVKMFAPGYGAWAGSKLPVETGTGPAPLIPPAK
jgi:rhodanese-related sulfurtransferase